MHYPSNKLSKFGQIEYETVRGPLHENEKYHPTTLKMEIDQLKWFKRIIEDRFFS